MKINKADRNAVLPQFMTWKTRGEPERKLIVSDNEASILPSTTMYPKCFVIVDHKTVLAVTNVVAQP